MRQPARTAAVGMIHDTKQTPRQAVVISPASTRQQSATAHVPHKTRTRTGARHYISNRRVSPVRDFPNPDFWSHSRRSDRCREVVGVPQNLLISFPRTTSSRSEEPAVLQLWRLGRYRMCGNQRRWSLCSEIGD